MSPKMCKDIERRGKIFDEMESKRVSDPEYFEDILKQAGGDNGIAMAFYYSCIEQELEEHGKI